MKTDTVFKRAFNDALDLVSKLGDGEAVPSENHLSGRLGVSRTTVRKVLSTLAGTGRRAQERALQHRRFGQRRRYSVFRRRKRFPWRRRSKSSSWNGCCATTRAREPPSTSSSWRGEFGVATTGIREFLNRFQRFGLIEKRPNAGWVFKGFTASFALELFEIREMFELRSAIAFAALPESSPLWQQLEACAQSMSRS